MADVISLCTEDRDLFIKAFQESLRELYIHKPEFKVIYKKLERRFLAWYYYLILLNEEDLSILFFEVFFETVNTTIVFSIDISTFNPLF